VKVSDDAGTYVCNYAYYLSLRECERLRNQIQNEICDAVFVHMPRFVHLNEEIQFQFLVELITKLSRMHENIV